MHKRHHQTCAVKVYSLYRLQKRKFQMESILRLKLLGICTASLPTKPPGSLHFNDGREELNPTLDKC